MRKWRHLFLGATVGLAVGITLSLAALGCWRLLSGSSGTASGWNAKAIRASEPPSFDVDSSGNRLVLRYQLTNFTPQDYELSSQDQLKAVMMKAEDGSLIGPLGNSLCQLLFPIFIPAGQRTNVTMTLPGFVVDTKNIGEGDGDYHERLRQNLESKYGKIAGLIIYDEVRHYQINLPRWLAKKPK